MILSQRARLRSQHQPQFVGVLIFRRYISDKMPSLGTSHRIRIKQEDSTPGKAGNHFLFDTVSAVYYADFSKEKGFHFRLSAWSSLPIRSDLYFFTNSVS